jgi:hypothetical protein
MRSVTFKVGGNIGLLAAVSAHTPKVDGDLLRGERSPGHRTGLRPQRVPDQISARAPTELIKYISIKSIDCVVPQEGFEPPTPSLRMKRGSISMKSFR